MDGVTLVQAPVRGAEASDAVGAAKKHGEGRAGHGREAVGVAATDVLGIRGYGRCGRGR